MGRILLRYVSRANPTADRCAQFFRGAAALECGGLTPLWEQRLLPPGNPPRNDVQDRSTQAKLQKCYEITLIKLATRHLLLATCQP